MRNSLIPQMIDTLGRNLSRQVESAAFFEMGRVFLKDSQGAIREEDRVSVGLMGKVGRVGLDRRRPVEPLEAFLWVKGIVESFCRVQRGGDVTLRPVQQAGFEPGSAVSLILSGTPIGVLGLVSQGVRSEWRMNEPVAVAELALKPLLAHVFEIRAPKSPPAYPSVARDVAMIVDERVTHEDVVRVIGRAAPAELTDIELFDIFRGEEIGAGRKSLAYSMVFRSQQKTLTDEDANRYQEAIKAALRNELRAEIREN